MTFRAPARVCRLVFLCLATLAALPLFAKDVWDAAPLTAAPKEMLAAAAAVDPKGSNVVYLLNESSYSFEADGRTKNVWHLISRVVTEDGAEETGTVSAWWQPWFDEKPTIEARVIGADGSVHKLDQKAVVEATQEAEQDMFSDSRVLRAPLPGVTKGAIIEQVVTTLGRSPIPGAGKFARFEFASGAAIERSRLVLDAAPGVTTQIVNKSGVEPRVSEEGGRKVTVFEKGHTDGVEEEEILPPDELAYPYVAFATGTSWAEIAKNYSAIVDKQIAAADVKDLVAKTIGNETSRAVVMEKLLDVIRKNVRYAGVEVGDGSIVPRTPSFVIQNKYGDCKDKATLLVAMLRAAGIDAHVALLDAAFSFDTIPSLPGADSFNHAIVVVDGNPSVWIDPTDEYSRAGALPLQDQGRMALIAAPATTALARTPETPSTDNRYVETRVYTLPEDGRARVVETTEGTSYEDATLRRDYATAEKKQYRESIEKFALEYFVAAKMEALETGDPHDFAKPFTLKIDVSKSKSGVVLDGEADVIVPTYALVTYVPHILTDYEPKSAEAESAKPEKKRVHDFVFSRPMTRQWIYRVTPPPGYRAQTLPNGETTKLGTTTLKSEYAQEADGTVVAKYTFDTGKRRITPAEFEETRKALSALARGDGAHIRFQSVGQAKIAAGDIRGALEEFRKLAAQHPKEALHHIELARALLAGGLGEAARDEARKAVEVEPGSAKAHAMLATVLERDLLGREHRKGWDLPGAIAELRKAKSIEPNDAEMRLRLAELLMYGDDGYRFGRNAHLAECADEFRALLKDLPKEAKGQSPRLMLVLSYLGKWNEVKELAKKEADTRQRNLFLLMATAATEGSAAGLRELSAFDTATQRSYGTAVGQSFMAMRRYSEAADFLEAASKGSDAASKTMPLVQMLRKTQLYDKVLDDSPKSFYVRLVKTLTTDDLAAAKAFFAPEVAATAGDDESFALNLRGISGDGEIRPDVILDLGASAMEMTVDGSDDVGFRYRVRSAGAAAETLYVVKRDGKLLFAGAGTTPALIGVQAMRLADAGKLDAARTWLNWARESLSAGGGDDPLSGPPFARLWQKETSTASADEIRLAAAALMIGKDFAAKSSTVLASLRDKAQSDSARDAVDVALISDYGVLREWAKMLPIAERLAKSHPDSDSAFLGYTAALAYTDRISDAEKLASERLAKRSKDEAAMNAMQNLAVRRGDYDAALKWARKLLDDTTASENDYNNAAWVALFRGKDLEKAIEDARHATADGNGGTAAAMHTLAAVYAETGNTTEARQALLKSMDMRGSSEPRSFDWFVLGRIAETYGVSDAAAAAYKRVTKEEPTGLSTWELAQKRLVAMNVK